MISVLSGLVMHAGVNGVARSAQQGDGCEDKPGESAHNHRATDHGETK